MPLKGSNKAAYQKEYMRKKRGLTSGLTETELPSEAGLRALEEKLKKEGVMKDKEWQHLKDYIERPAPKGTMSYLERHQRIAGSLGKLADQVEWGGLSVQEIKEVIGELPPLYPKD